jgi:hypothetical protein
MELEEAKEKALEMASLANAVVAIATDDDYRQAGELLTRIKGRARDLEELRKSLTRPLDESKKKIMALFAKPQDDLESAEGRLKKGMLEFSQRKEAERRAEEARLKKEEEVRNKAAEEARLKRVDAALAAGDERAAEEIFSAPASAQAMVIVAKIEPPKTAGVSVRKDWTWRVLDIGLLPKDYMLVNESMLTAIAKSSKGAMKVPGVEFYQKETIAASARY